MCLRLLLQLLRERPYQNLVDVGCGSGILALAGLKLGVERAVALDLDQQALSVSRANAELNHLAERLVLVRGSAEAVAGHFDLVVANLPMPSAPPPPSSAAQVRSRSATWDPAPFAALGL